MATKNSFYTPRRKVQRRSVGKTASASLLGFLLLSSACTQTPKKTDTAKPKPVVIEEKESLPPQVMDEALPPSVLNQGPPPKLGIVFGAAGFRSFSYVGVLRELEKAKIPIHSIVGLEWGALVASLYGLEGRVNDLEWQLLKIREADLVESSLFGASKKRASTEKLDGYLQKTLGLNLFSNLKLPVSCAIEQNGRLAWMKSGRVAAAMKSCLSFPPTFAGRAGVFAAVFSVEEAVKQLQAEGAEIVVFVNGIAGGPLLKKGAGAFDVRDEIIWSQLRKWYGKMASVADENIGVFLGTSLTEFNRRRSMVKGGESAGRALAELLTTKYGY